MSRDPSTLAPHVRAAIERAAGPVATAQAAPAAPHPGGPAPHVQAAIQRAAGPAAQLKPGNGAAGGDTAGGGAAAGGIQAGDGDAGAGKAAPPAPSALHGVSDYVTYTDVKSSGAPPPPPRRPVLALSFSDGTCIAQDVKTGRVQPAGNIFGGFVRMDKGSRIYMSPRAGVGAPGDSHPTIASGTPEWQTGVRTVVAAGEVGILNGEIVGHNDKTGHFQSRKNLRQSGMPAEKFHPFTQDPKDWYK